MEKRKKLLWKHELLHKTQVHIRKKERVYGFFELRKSWLGAKGFFFQRMNLVERWSFLSIYETCKIL